MSPGTLNSHEFIVETWVPIRSPDGWGAFEMELLLLCEFVGSVIEVQDAGEKTYLRHPAASERWLAAVGDELSLAILHAVQRWADTPEGQRNIMWAWEAMREREREDAA